MSITMSATSLAIYGVMMALSSVMQNVAKNSYTNYSSDYNFENEIQKAMRKNNVREIMKEYKTPFVDAEILKKTLLEHGCKDFDENNDLGFMCKIENFTFSFYRNSISEPFAMKISCDDDINCEEKIEDLNSEYRTNVQEETYLKLVSRLKNNNMQIESEKVLEDDSIMLTINLD